MADIAIFDDEAVAPKPQRVLDYLESVDTLRYVGRSDVVINPDVSDLIARDVPMRYWKHDAGLIVEYTQAEKNTQDAIEATLEDSRTRESAKDELTGFTGRPLLLRAFADILKDEINILRTWTRDFKDVVAAASNLNDVKTGVAALATLNDRTLVQLKTAINNRIDSGDVDT